MGGQVARAPTFVVVTVIALGVLLLGWRGLTAAVGYAMGRRALR